MDALELLLTRESASKLAAPGPSSGDLEQIFASAVRTPDHGRLRPWRFVVIDEAAIPKFGDLLAESLRRRDPSASEPELQRERGKAFRAPVIVTVAARVQKDHKIPAIEQIASASAAAQTIILAAAALGYGAVWKTGAPAYDSFVKTSLGLTEDDEILGFLYIGTRTDAGSALPRPRPQDFVIKWGG